MYSIIEHSILRECNVPLQYLLRSTGSCPAEIAFQIKLTATTGTMCIISEARLVGAVQVAVYALWLPESSLIYT
jgi:hypothetical protein